MAFKTICVDHVGIACAGTLEEAAKIYTEVLGLKATGTEEVKEQGVATVFVPCGETLIELLVDITENNDGPIGKYIAKNGPGIQHMALRVDDIKAAIADLTEAGVRMIDKAPRWPNENCFRSSEIRWPAARAVPTGCNLQRLIY